MSDVMDEETWMILRNLARGWIHEDMTLRSTDVAIDAFDKVRRRGKEDPHYQEILATPNHPEFRPLMYRVIERLVLDYRRKRARRRQKLAAQAEATQAEWVSDIANGGGEETARVEALDAERLLERLVARAKISPVRRARLPKILQSWLVDRKTQQEIADELGVAIGTINGDLKFAKAWLRAELCGALATPAAPGLKPGCADGLPGSGG